MLCDRCGKLPEQSPSASAPHLGLRTEEVRLAVEISLSLRYAIEHSGSALGFVPSEFRPDSVAFRPLWLTPSRRAILSPTEWRWANSSNIFSA
jgi:hypothetical protein